MWSELPETICNPTHLKSTSAHLLRSAAAVPSTSVLKLKTLGIAGLSQPREEHYTPAVGVNTKKGANQPSVSDGSLARIGLCETTLMEWVTPPFKKDRHPYRLQREFQFLEREQKVTKILSSGAFRSELENILQGHIDGSRRPPKLSKAIQQLQENVVPASRIESSSRTSPRYGAVIGRTYAAIQGVIPINDLRGASASKYTVAARQQRCKLAALYRLVDMFGWAQLIDNLITVSNFE